MCSPVAEESGSGVNEAEVLNDDLTTHFDERGHVTYFPFKIMYGLQPHDKHIFGHDIRQTT